MASRDPIITSSASPIPPPMAVSPHSSMSAETPQSPRAPTSPFLHNLHHRFRKGSNASSSMSSDATNSNVAAASQDPTDRAEATQSAKRFLHNIVRDDWQYPTNPLQVDTSEDTLKKHEALAAREPVAWRTRFEAESDIDLDSDGSAAGFGRKKKRKTSDPYRFENPDAIAVDMTERKIKRRKKLELEMEWNEGLRLWDAQRDLWTGAVRFIPRKKSSLETSRGLAGFLETRKKSSASSSKNTETPISQPNGDITTVSANSDGSSNWPLPSPTEAAAVSHISPASPTVNSHLASSPESVDPPLVQLPDAPSTANDPNAPYLPIYPPLIPSSHTIRSRIKPAAYPTIYSKVVVQSLTPNVPIPLTHMIGALVDGWKAEGNWPPQTLAEQKMLLARKSNKKGESAFGRWKREQEVKKMIKHGEVDAAVQNGHDEDTEKKGFRRSLTGAVKKVLGMNGEEDADGGLERLGIRFSDGDGGPDGFIGDEQNMYLDKGVVEERS